MSNVVNLDVAKRVDIICRKGDTFKLEIDLKAADGTQVAQGAYNFNMEVSPNSGAGDTSAEIILSTKDDANGNKKIAYTTSLGKVIFNVPNTKMKSVAAGLYVYDIEAISTANSEESQTWLYGTFKINEDISV